MSLKPVIFVSAVSGELKSARQLVANTLAFLGYEPQWQDIFGMEEGDLRAMLRRRIDASAGVVQLVGSAYGFEAAIPDETFGRVSYTQYEALYARQKGRKVWYVFLDEAFPCDVCPPEDEDKRTLQSEYRKRLQGQSHLYQAIASQDALQASVLKLRNDLSRLRRGVRQWAALVVTLLILLAAASLVMLQRQSRTTEKISELSVQNEKLLAALREIPQALSPKPPANDEEAEATRMARLYAALEEKLKLSAGTLERQLPSFAEALLLRADTSNMDRANALFAIKKFAEAETQALTAKDRLVAASVKLSGEAIAALVLAGKAAAAQLEDTRALNHFREASKLTNVERDPMEWATVQFAIASTLHNSGQLNEAEGVCRGILPVIERLHGADSEHTLNTRSLIASILSRLGKGAEAEAAHQAVLAVLNRVQGPEHPATLTARRRVASAMSQQGKYEEALSALRELSQIEERVLGADDPETLRTWNALAWSLLALERYDETEREFQPRLAAMVRVLGPEHFDTLNGRDTLGEVWRRQGKVAEAEAQHRTVLAVRERVLEPGNPAVMESCYHLALALEAQKKMREALQLATRAEAGFRQTAGVTSNEFQDAKALRIRLEAEVAAPGKVTTQ